MKGTSPTSVHAPYTQELIEEGDWAGLVRYWMAHQHEAALEQAVTLVGANLKQRGERWQLLGDFLLTVRRDPISFDWQLPNLNAEDWSAEENLTILLITLYRRAMMCEFARHAAPEMRGLMLRDSLEAAAQACHVAEAIEDGASWAFYRSAMARCYLELEQLEPAKESYIEALALYKTLTDWRPQAYRRFFANTLTNLAKVQVEFHEFEDARDSYIEARLHLRRAAEREPGRSVPALFRLLRNLGTVQSSLGDLNGARDSLFEAAELVCVLAAQQPQVYNSELAETYWTLGVVLRDSIAMEGAKKSFQAALTIYRALAKEEPDRYSTSVVKCLDCIGTIESFMNEPEAARESLNEGVTLCRRLAKRKPADHRAQLAGLLNNLGNVQHHLMDLDGASASFGEALAIYRTLYAHQPAPHHVDLGMTLTNLASVRGELGHWEEASKSLQEAITLFRQLGEGGDELRPALLALTLNNQDYRHYLAAALSNLGVMQTKLTDWREASKTFHEAITLLRNLAKDRPELYQPPLATALSNLANAQRHLLELEAAKKSVQEALLIQQHLAERQPAIYLPAVMMTLCNVGSVLAVSMDLTPALESLNEALTLCRQLAKERPEILKPKMALILGTLGLVQGDSGEWEAARETLNEAVAINRQLAEERPETYEDELANTLNTLGVLQWRIREMVPARECFLEALAIRRRLAKSRPAAYKAEVASCLNNLGAVRLQLSELEAAEETMGEALTLYRQLAIDEPLVYRFGVARCLHNLGSVQSELKEWEAARNSLMEALAVRRELAGTRPHVYRAGVAETLNNLGNVHVGLNELSAAYGCFREAAEILESVSETKSGSYLIERLQCWRNLGLLYRRNVPEHSWPDHQKARQALRRSFECADAVRNRFANPRQRERIQSTVLNVYEEMIQSCIDVWVSDSDVTALQEAVEVAEASRARNLVDLLADESLEPANVPESLVAEFRVFRRRLRQAERRIEDEAEQAATGMGEWQTSPKFVSADFNHEMTIPTALSGGHSEIAVVNQTSRAPGRVGYLEKELSDLREQYQGLLERIRQPQHDPEFNPDQPVPSLKFDCLRSLLPKDGSAAVVQYTLGRDRGIALVVTNEKVLVVLLPNLNKLEAWDLAMTWYEGYYARHGTPDHLRSWQESLPDCLQPVAHRAIWPVTQALLGSGVKRLILSPNQALNFFPLHACKLPDGRYLADAYEVSYTPSMSILSVCANRHREHRQTLFLVENPTYDLAFTEIEGAELRRLYPTHTSLKGVEADKERLFRDSTKCHVFHYSGHARFDMRKPMESALILGDIHDQTKWLTLRDVFCSLHMRENLLTVISGCESGMLRPDKVDEYVGLPSGFLYAGAACVLSTLWAVNDVSSGLLMDRFHAEWLGGRSIGGALREAQRWLREDIVSGSYLQRDVLPGFLDQINDTDLSRLCERVGENLARRYPDRPPFASPVHWAPFIASGLTYSLSS